MRTATIRLEIAPHGQIHPYRFIRKWLPELDPAARLAMKGWYEKDRSARNRGRLGQRGVHPRTAAQSTVRKWCGKRKTCKVELPFLNGSFDDFAWCRGIVKHDLKRTSNPGS